LENKVKPTLSAQVTPKQIPNELKWIEKFENYFFRFSFIKMYITNYDIKNLETNIVFKYHGASLY